MLFIRIAISGLIIKLLNTSIWIDQKNKGDYISLFLLLQLNIEKANFIQHNPASIIIWVIHASNLRNKFKIMEGVGEDILV